jgi:hypothetical protein
MRLAGKYMPNQTAKYVPDVFPNQRLMHQLANASQNLEMKDAFLRFQYPFKLDDLINSSYSPEIKKAIIDATFS